MKDGAWESDVDSPDDPPGEDVVWHALSKLKPAPELDGSIRNDPERLADALLDHAERFDGTRLLYLMTALFAPILDPLAQELCISEYLMLDPHELTNECVVSLYAASMDGTRQQPFGRWARQRLRRVARRAAACGDLPSFVAEQGAPPKALFLTELSRLCNRCSYPVRQLAWLAFVEGKPYPSIANMTGIPLERVEALLKRLIHLGRRAMQEGVAGRIRREAKPVEEPYWRSAHEGSGDG